MDSLEAMYFVDDFLNFSLDIEDQNPKEEEEEEEEQNQKQQDNDEETYQKHPRNPCFDSKSKTHKTHLNTLDRDEDSSPVLEEEGEEEELEWLKDEFPPFEPFVVGSFQTPKHQSPVSVLESGFRVPVRARSRIQRRKRVGDSGLVSMWGGDGRRGGVAVVEARRRCRHCLAEKTPQWRAGPLGPKTLCNACGVRYKAGRLVPEYRPASSPSFSSELHSNSHRKILEIRRQKHKGVEKG